jgi:hypothetical protein
VHYYFVELCLLFKIFKTRKVIIFCASGIIYIINEVIRYVVSLFSFLDFVNAECLKLKSCMYISK